MRHYAYILLVLELITGIVVCQNKFGDGTDGDLVVEIGETYLTDQVKTSVLGNNNSGFNALNVTSTNGFSVSDEVLIITMQDPSTNNIDENNTGNYEFRIISSIVDGHLYFENNLENTYEQDGSQIHQVIRVPNFSNITNNGTISCSSWNGTVGGVLSLKVSGEMVNNGTISVGGGYRGGGIASWSSGGNFTGFQGESIFGAGSQNISANQNGGGGGGHYNYGHSGGGGGNLNNGSIGYATCNSSQYNNSYFGAGGSSVFSTNTGNKLIIGGGGGGGAWDNSEPGQGQNPHPGSGGRGGGCVLIHANNIINSGDILANGANGNDYYYPGLGYHCGGGGAGAGGTIKIISSDQPGGTITANGGSGGQGWCNYGGDGASGIIIISLAYSGPIWHVSTSGSDNNDIPINETVSGLVIVE